MVLRLLLCNEYAVNSFLSQFEGINVLNLLSLPPSLMSDVTISTNLMFTKYQMMYKGGKTKDKDTNDASSEVVQEFFNLDENNLK